MPALQANLLLGHIRALACAKRDGAKSDRDLLRRFVEAHDEGAFDALLQRHGPMVLSVCRRTLPGWQDVEDAFQATFLTLARKACSIRKPDALGCWLHGVAFRLAQRIRTAARKQPPPRSAPTPATDPSLAAAAQELRQALDEELLRLPEKLRAPLVLCYLEGLVRDQAAQQLGCPLATLKARLERGRTLLRQRLTRRGLSLSTALAVAALSPAAVSAVPVALRQAAHAVALRAGVLSPAVARLVSAGLAFGRLKTASVLLGIVLLCAGVGALVHQALNPGRDGLVPWPEPSTADMAQVPSAPPSTDSPPSDAFALTGQVTDKESGRPVAGATVTVRRLVYRNGQGSWLGEERLVEQTQHRTDAEGRYRFTIGPEQVRIRDLYVEVRVEHPDYAPRNRFDGAVGYPLSWLQDKGKNSRRFFERVQLHPGKPITGIVETPDGKPAAGIKVMAVSTPQNSEEALSDFLAWTEAKTDAQGRFQLTAVTPGHAAVWVLPRDFAPVRNVLQDNQRGDLGRMTLPRGQRLTGRVADRDGKPVAGVYVNARASGSDPALAPLHVADLGSRSALTDANGGFKLAPLAEGPYEVQPYEQAYESSPDGKPRGPRRLPGVFTPQLVTLREGVTPEPLEFRGGKQVLIEARYIDSKGKPGRAYEFQLFGRIDAERYWSGTGKVGKDGIVTAFAPHGLEDVRLRLMAGPQFALRWRKAGADSLRMSCEAELGTLTGDVKGIEIVQYRAPVLRVKVKAKDGAALKEIVVTADYVKAAGEGLDRYIRPRGLQSHVIFVDQGDGSFRSQRLLPDEEALVTAHVEGYGEASAKIKLAEGVEESVELVVEKK
jgi:RNA polymerase sigma factor (sigma-70 family)